MDNDLVKEQKPPEPNDRPAVWDLVIKDMLARDGEGRRKYGTPLQPFNGRDVLVDAYQEALDLVVYLRQAIYERSADPRTLLEEAREYVHGCTKDSDEPCECDECTKATDLLNKIDNLLDGKR